MFSGGFQMPKFRIGLQLKLTLSFSILLVIIAGLTFYSTYKQTREALRDELSSMAAMAASQVNGDDFSSIKPGDEGKNEFKAIRTALLKMEKSNKTIKYIYSYRRYNSKSVKYVVDAEYGISKDAVRPGDVCATTTRAMFEGLKNPACETYFATDESGTFLSGFAPIRNSKGKAVGAVGIDITSAQIIEKQKFLGLPGMISIIISICAASLLVALMSLTIIKDVRKLTDTANRISTGDMDVKIDVKRSDEIGELADSFKRMAASVKILMQDESK
jgi:two-component system sensor histidine kinase/response regulator